MIDEHGDEGEDIDADMRVRLMLRMRTVVKT